MLRSGIYEAGQSYSRGIAGGTEDGFRDGMRRYYGELGSDADQSAAFEEWLGYVKQNPTEHVDIRDRFYVEQRVGGWAAAIEQSLDMNDFLSVQIANCAELISVLLSCNEEERRVLSLSYGTVRLMKPELLEKAVNPVGLTDKLRRVGSIARDPVGKLRNYLNKKKR